MHHLLLLALLFNLFFIVPAKSFAGTSTTTYQRLSDSQKLYWNYLLHFDDSKRKSKFAGEKFFLSSNGKKSPEDEFNATLAAFVDAKKSVGWFNYPVQCVFRERYNFLKKLGLLNNISETPCPMFEDWKKGLNAESVTFVFSSSYPNNPSSLFGHTLMRLNQKNKNNDLLDYSIAFSAIPESDDMGIVFAFKGMFGGYKGLIEISKYYNKVNDYTNSESRDLIEYNLDLNNEQLDRLINHVWEIYQTTYLDYYFFDENCSSVLADILAVALYEIPGIKKHSRWYYLPSELVKVLNSKKGLVTSIKYRPSIKKQLEKKLENLNTLELEELIKSKQHGNLEPISNSANVLDALISTLDYKRYWSKNHLSDEEKKLMRNALIKRSSLKFESPIYTEYLENNRPELGHESRNFQTFLRSENEQSLLGVVYKTGYHNLMSRDLGFDPFSEFDFFTGSFVYNMTKKKLNYDELIFVHLTSLHEYTFYDPQFSWDAGLKSDRYFNRNCELCHKFEARAIGGLTIKPYMNTYFNLHAGVYAELTPKLWRGHRTGPETEISILMNLSDQFKIGFFEEFRISAYKKVSENFQNINRIKISYFPEINNDYGLEYKILTQVGSFKEDTHILQMSYGKYF